MRRDARTGRLRFLEVKGRISGAATITVTKNEILYSLNKPEDFILATRLASITSWAKTSDNAMAAPIILVRGEEMHRSPLPF